MSATEMVDVTFTLTMTYPVPADLAVREDLYGTTDLSECLQIDIDNDPAAFILDSTLLDVAVTGEQS